jgi:hypothetical protein
MNYRDSSDRVCTPACPVCHSRETSFCGETRDGVVWLCSPCCEAFFWDSDAETGDAPIQAGRRILVSALVAFGFCLLVWVAVTPKPTSVPPPSQPVSDKAIRVGAPY